MADLNENCHVQIRLPNRQSHYPVSTVATNDGKTSMIFLWIQIHPYRLSGKVSLSAVSMDGQSKGIRQLVRSY